MKVDATRFGCKIPDKIHDFPYTTYACSYHAQIRERYLGNRSKLRTAAVKGNQTSSRGSPLVINITVIMSSPPDLTIYDR